MQMQRQRAHLIDLPCIAVGKVAHVEADGQRFVPGQAHVLIDQEDGLLPVAERELLLYRIKRDRLPAVGAALIKLRAVLGIDLLVSEVLLIEFGLAHIVKQ